jgi:hypothetical protein
MSDWEQYKRVRNSFNERSEYRGGGFGKYTHKTALSKGVYEGPVKGEGVINLPDADESIEYSFDVLDNRVLLYTSHTIDEIDELLGIWR